MERVTGRGQDAVWQVRLLAEAEKKACRELWEEVFTEDSRGFLDYYDRWKYPENECFGIFDGDRLVSMAQFNPYKLRIRTGAPAFRTVESRYVIAVATREEYRHRGMMAALLKEGLGRMREKGMPFVFLMPAAEAIYRPFGFRYFYESCGGALAFESSARAENGTDEKGAGGREAEACLAGPSDIPELTAFSEEVLSGLFDCYVKRDRRYYEMLLPELACEGGGLLLIRCGKRLLAEVPYWGEDQTELREVLCRPEHKDQVLSALGRWFGSGRAGKRLRQVSFQGAAFPGAEKKPVIMGRIADAGSFLELFSAERPAEILLELSDGLLKENEGIYRWRLSPEGSRAERLSPSEAASLEEPLLRAAQLPDSEEETSGGGRTSRSPGLPRIRTTAEELFSCLTGERKLQGPLRMVRPCRRSYINEIV